MMAIEEEIGTTGVVAAIIIMTIGVVKVTITTVVDMAIDKEGMIIVIKEVIMTITVEATTTTIIGGVEVVQEITTVVIDPMTMEVVDMVVVEDMVELVMVVEEEDETNRVAMQILECEEIGETRTGIAAHLKKNLKSPPPVSNS